ncbi:YjiH family protein [Cytobacillus kochii]|uniref:Histidine transporter n=1 Tax=Cytobacillus kochii TaxID=859143 RepID=A0A248TMW9_9BACI|nr:YjiH family protein [Cytobacillus kochii]ASV69588.1 histidine transporter [Cytobacillus kochii]
METELSNPKTKSQMKNANSHVWKFFIYSMIGIFMFFIPITLNGQSSIMIDHIVSGLRHLLGNVVPYYLLLIIMIGGLYPFIKGNWKETIVTTVFSFLKLLGVVIAFMVYFNLGPAFIFDPNMGPFLFNSLVTPVGLLVPIGSVFLALLVGYGLLEFIGVIMKPVMRPIFQTPGRSAIDAVASFVGSYSVGILITNRIFKEGKYSMKEAAIIVTGFSTVSVTFMIVVAKALDLMFMWAIYFWTSFIITFVVTAITVRIWPIRNMSNEYYQGVRREKDAYDKPLLKTAWKEAMKAAASAPSIFENVKQNLKDGVLMTLSILPSIMSIGLIGLVLVEYTPVFDWLAYLFYPFTAILGLPEAMLTAKATSVGIVEMFLPSMVVTEAALMTKFIIGVVSVSGIIFFSALVPCILSTDIPITIRQMVIIWFERTVLALILVTPIAYLLF